MCAGGHGVHVCENGKLLVCEKWGHPRGRKNNNKHIYCRQSGARITAATTQNWGEVRRKEAGKELYSSTWKMGRVFRCTYFQTVLWKFVKRGSWSGRGLSKTKFFINENFRQFPLNLSHFTEAPFLKRDLAHLKQMTKRWKQLFVISHHFNLKFWLNNGGWCF